MFSALAFYFTTRGVMDCAFLKAKLVQIFDSVPPITEGSVPKGTGGGGGGGGGNFGSFANNNNNDNHYYTGYGRNYKIGFFQYQDHSFYYNIHNYKQTVHQKSECVGWTGGNQNDMVYDDIWDTVRILLRVAGMLQLLSLLFLCSATCTVYVVECFWIVSVLGQLVSLLYMTSFLSFASDACQLEGCKLDMGGRYMIAGIFCCMVASFVVLDLHPPSIATSSSSIINRGRYHSEQHPTTSQPQRRHNISTAKLRSIWRRCMLACLFVGILVNALVIGLRQQHNTDVEGPYTCEKLLLDSSGWMEPGSTTNQEDNEKDKVWVDETKMFEYDPEHFMGPCDFEVRGRPAFWKRIVGTGKGVTVVQQQQQSPEQPDMQGSSERLPNIILLEGDSCENLVCEESSSSATVPFASGTQDSLHKWHTQVGKQYFILLFDANAPYYILKPPLNDECSNAISVVVPSSSSLNDGVTLEGQTTSAFYQSIDRDSDSSLGRSTCHQEEPQHAQVWYRVTGTGKAFLANFCGTPETYRPGISVYRPGKDAVFRSDCSQPHECVGQVSMNDPTSCTIKVSDLNGTNVTTHSMTTTFVWMTDWGVDYLMSVYSTWTDREAPYEKFRLTLQELDVVPNDQCNNAIDLLPFEIAMDDHEYSLNDTRWITLSDFAPDPCVRNVADVIAKGFWYKAKGTGTGMVASTCTSRTNYPALISVYKGRCNQLECIAQSEPTDPQLPKICQADRDTGSILWWMADVDETYYILVRETETWPFVKERDFGLKVWKNVDGLCSIDATGPVPTNGTEVIVSTARADGDNKIWFTVIGNGGNIAASTCVKGATASVQSLEVSQSCQDEQPITYVNSTESEKCGRSAVVLLRTEPERKYFLAVRVVPSHNIHNSVVGLAVLALR